MNLLLILIVEKLLRMMFEVTLRDRMTSSDVAERMGVQIVDASCRLKFVCHHKLLRV